MASKARSQQAIILFKNLNHVDQDYLDRRLTLTRDTPIATIGRSSKRKVELGPSAKNAYFDCPVMSRDHAELRADFDEQIVNIQDTGSLHGTLLNKLGLRPTEPHPLRTGDIISFGSPVDRGSDKFSPREVEAEVTWEAMESPPRGVTYSVPDDTDVEELSDGEDSAPEMIYAKKTLIANNYQPADHKCKSIDLTSPVLPPISSFDGPAKDGALVDLTLDAAGAEWLRRASARSNPGLDNNPLPPIINVPRDLSEKLIAEDRPEEAEVSHLAAVSQEFAEPPALDDYSEEDEESSLDSHDGNIQATAICCVSDEDEDEDEDVDALGLSDDYNSDDEADDLWGVADDGLDEFGGIADVDYPPAAGDSEEAAEAAVEVPTVKVQATKEHTTKEQASFPPTKFALAPDVPKAPTLSGADKSAFWTAREQNRKTLGLPTKAETTKVEAAKSGDERANILNLSGGIPVNMSNELLRTGNKFLNEPPRASEITQKPIDSENPDLDETSAYRFEMSKKKTAQPAHKEQDQPEAKELELLGNTASKRKADEISETSPQEDAAEPRVGQRSPEQEPAKLGLMSASHLTPPAVDTPIVSSCTVDHKTTLHSSTNPLERPAKRLRRAAEVVGYAAIGGIAVMSALIATAPQL